MGTSADDKQQLLPENSTHHTAICEGNNLSYILLSIIVVGFILSRLYGRIPKKKTSKGEVEGKRAVRENEFSTDDQKISKGKKTQNKKGSLSKKGLGPRKVKNTGREKGDKAKAPTNKGLAKIQVTPPRDCRHKEARLAGGSRICCNAKDRRKAATAAGSRGKRLPAGWMRYLSAWLSWCSDHGPTIQASWTHDSAYGCHKKSPHKKAKRTKSNQSSTPRFARPPTT